MKDGANTGVAVILIGLIIFGWVSELVVTPVKASKPITLFGETYYLKASVKSSPKFLDGLKNGLMLAGDSLRLALVSVYESLVDPPVILRNPDSKSKVQYGLFVVDIVITFFVSMMYAILLLFILAFQVFFMKTVFTYHVGFLLGIFVFIGLMGFVNE